jgi:hypothetical protein
LTCRRFRSLAQALIFRSCFLNCDGDEIDGDLLPHHSARLDFYSSDAIAPFVRMLGIIISGGLPQPVPVFTNSVAKIFDALPRFINIRSLYCSGVNFTQFALYQVSTLSCLEHLTATDCSVPPTTDSLPMLRPRSFQCLGSVSRVAHHWLALLDPDHLQDLHIPLTEDSCSFFTADANPSISPFPSLHSVDLDIDQETLPMLPMLPMILSNTPALRSLKLFPFYSDTAQYIPTVEAPAACPVPYLENYYGPHKLLPIILGRAMGSPSARLRRVYLERVDEAEGFLDSFMNSFKSCHPLQLRAVTHIHLSLFESMDSKSLAKLRDMFPVLQVFNLHASEQYNRSGLSCEFPNIPCQIDAIFSSFSWIAFVQNVNLTDLYTLLLPSTLISLSIQWTSDPDAGVAPDLVAAKDNFLSRLPYLRRLWLYDLSKMALLWSRNALRTEERCTVHEGE